MKPKRTKSARLRVADPIQVRNVPTADLEYLRAKAQHVRAEHHTSDAATLRWAVITLARMLREETS